MVWAHLMAIIRLCILASRDGSYVPYVLTDLIMETKSGMFLCPLARGTSKLKHLF